MNKVKTILSKIKARSKLKGFNPCDVSNQEITEDETKIIDLTKLKTSFSFTAQITNPEDFRHNVFEFIKNERRERNNE